MVLDDKSRNSPKDLGRIGVLMGGPSSERDISLNSGNAVYESLKSLNQDVVAIDIKTDGIEENIKLIDSYKLDCAFVVLHGRFGEDGEIQGILDKLKIPYTGSSKAASRLSIDKAISRKRLKKQGITIPEFKVINKNSKFSMNGFSFPCVIKPATQGSSIGLSIVDNKSDVNKALDLAFEYDPRIIIEEYISGRELTVGILEDKALPIVEIVPKRRFFDFQAKYSNGLTDYMVPANLEKEMAEIIQRVALRVHNALGCYAYSRVDIILSQDNIPFVLEINTIPGFTATSLLPKAAKANGIEFNQLCLKLIELAYAKK